MAMTAALQMYIVSKDEQYASRFTESIWPMLDRSVNFGIKIALQAIPYMDQAYHDKLKEYVISYKQICDDLNKQNPYGVPMATGGWGENGGIVNWAMTNYYAQHIYPDIFNPEYVYKGLNFVFGCHTYSNISFVSSVGTRSKKITYGSNRADFSLIAGGIVPGLLLLKPDFPENREDWPFLWGENEVTIGGCADYILLSTAVNHLSTGE